MFFYFECSFVFAWTQLIIVVSFYIDIYIWTEDWYCLVSKHHSLVVNKHKLPTEESKKTKREDMIEANTRFRICILIVRMKNIQPLKLVFILPQNPIFFFPL